MNKRELEKILNRETGITAGVILHKKPKKYVPIVSAYKNFKRPLYHIKGQYNYKASNEVNNENLNKM